MPYLQPTVRQLQPLGRPRHSAPLPEEVDEAVSASAPGRRRRRLRLQARTTPSA